MLKGIIKVFDEHELEIMHQSVLEVLEKTGLKIHGNFLLKALAEAGCRVDFQKQQAWLKPEVVQNQIEKQRNRYKMVRSSLTYPFCRELPENDVANPDEFCVDYGFNVVWMYDYPSGIYRAPTAEDQINMIKLGEALEPVKYVNIPFVCSEFDAKIETIESARLLLLNTSKPGVVEVNNAVQVKYLAELAYLAAENNEEKISKDPPVITYVYCTTSPLKIDDRSCNVLEQSLKYGFPVCFASMPILGGTTPVTPAGSIVVAAAEILGGIAATSLLYPDLYYFGCSISGEMDMQTTNIRFSTPAAILTDAGLHQLFKYKYGLVLNVDPAYIEAKAPGIQASLLKAFRQIALGCTSSNSLPIGVLDNASAFSPVQAMIDLDFNSALYKFFQGIKVTKEMIDLDLIHRTGFGDKGAYLGSQQTLDFFKDILWHSDILDTTYRREKFYKAADMDNDILDKADKKFKSLLSNMKAFEAPGHYRKKIDKVIESARKELL
ncbi:MAG: trimethylamine methyltransferase family protein [Actinobacteria bacterium]|nr:trimethylamine methyltransferase family protein [Actinomycetota bacterium]